MNNMVVKACGINAMFITVTCKKEYNVEGYFGYVMKNVVNSAGWKIA